jgi:ABC-2 type transport system permease protein
MMARLFTVASKEFSDIVRSKRFILLVIIFGLGMVAAIAATYTTARTATARTATAMPTRFLGLAGFMLPSMLAYLVPIIGIGLGCDAISGEKEKGSLKLVLAQPVYRDDVINGKFLAAISAITLAIIITLLASVGGSISMLGITLTADEAGRLSLYMVFALLFAMLYYGIAAFLSTVSKRTSQSIIIAVAIWVVFTFVIPIISNFIAVATVGVPTFTAGQQPDPEQMRRFTSVVQSVQSITPNYHFSQIGRYLLSPFAGTQAGAQQSALSITQSLAHAWANIAVLAIATPLPFIACYMMFIRQEIS